jgi:ABC-type branched-subunit amino acid transport system ATPase component
MHISDDEILLQVNHLSTGYGKRQVLFDVSFEVKRGEIVLLIGGNGSGKSTLLKAIYGELPAVAERNFSNNEKWVFSPLFKSKGCITFDNEDITNIKSYLLIRRGLVYVPQKNNSFDHLTVMENLEVVSTYLNKAELKQRVDIVFEQLPQMRALKKRTPFHLSGGERQQLALGIALMHHPKMILLDEPGAGLSPNAWQRNLETIEKLNKTGITFLIVEHKLKETLEKADKILGLKLGKISIDMPISNIVDASQIHSLFV